MNLHNIQAYKVLKSVVIMTMRMQRALPAAPQCRPGSSPSASFPPTVRGRRGPPSSESKREQTRVRRLPVRLGDTLELVLLLDGVRVRRALGSVDELVGKALGDALDVAERRLADTDGDERDGLVDAAEGRDVDGLAADGALRANAGRVLTRASVDDGVDEDLDRVLVGEEVDDLERVGDDADGHLLLAVVAAVHHEAVDEALNNGHLG